MELKTSPETVPNVTAEKLPQPQLGVHRLYVKSSQFEAALVTPALLKKAEAPHIELQVQMGSYPQEEDQHEAVLTLQVTSKHEGNLLWRLQLQQAGLYTLQGLETEEQRKQVLQIFCMNQLYPYACAAASDLVLRGGFQSMYLPPMDFNALYQKQLEEQKKQKQAAPILHKDSTSDILRSQGSA